MPKKFLLALCVATIGLAVACGKSNSPVSPSPSSSATDALPDGSTLKINAPQVVFPTNGVQLQRNQPFIVTLNNVNGRFATFPVTYELEVRNQGGAVVASHRFPAAQGNATSFTVPNELVFDANHSLRIRATYRNSVGPWSAVAILQDPAPGVPQPPDGRGLRSAHGGFQRWQRARRPVHPGSGLANDHPRMTGSTTTSPPARTASSSST